jgi:hypothetical protein
MPWSVRDVDRFKKGLTAKQKRQWVAIANTTLAKCKQKGGTEESCAASAIRQANGITGNMAMDVHTVSNEGYTIREERHQGRTFIVVPVVMMVEGVHNGSAGPIFHSIEELGKIPGSWNGIPITIDHPQIEDTYVSANIPILIDTRTVGRVYNTYVEDDKLKAEAWIDVEQITQISPETLVQIREGQILEVSVGVFTDDEEVENENWNGESYNAIARNHRPDHLALLPGGVGACSVDDGCGIRNNNKRKGGSKVENNSIELIKNLKKDDSWYLENIISNLSQGLVGRLDNLRRKIDSLDTTDVVHYLREAFDDYIIYETSMRVGGSKLYRQAYTIEDNGNVVFVGESEEVYKKVEYLKVQNNVIRFNTNKKEVKRMSEKPKCPSCKEKIDKLVANNSSKFIEEDREWLETLEEANLDKIIEASKVEKKEEKPVKTNSEKINVLSDEDKAALEYGKRQLKERREKYVKGIQDNAGKELWPDDQLATMSDNMLERLYNSVVKEEQEIEQVDYSLNSVGISRIQSNEFEPLYPTGVEVETK